MRVRGWPVAGVGLAVLWLFVRGVEPAHEAVAATYVGRVLAGIAGTFLFGLLVGMPTAYVFRRTIPERVDPARWLRVTGPIVVYVASFLRELIVATFDVAYRALAPGPPIDPEVIYLPLRVESDAAVTTLANTITLTPGTIALDHDEERNALYVHAIDGRNLEALVAPIRTWEDNALTIFDEPGEPTEEPPQVLVTGDEVREVLEEPEIESGDSVERGGSAGSGDSPGDRSANGGESGGE